MKTVRDIFVEALALKRRGLRPRQIADRLIDLGHENGFSRIEERGAGVGGSHYIIELVFPDGETIDFDGVEWHHRSSTPPAPELARSQQRTG